jgi:hypothetical protein
MPPSNVLFRTASAAPKLCARDTALTSRRTRDPDRYEARRLACVLADPRVDRVASPKHQRQIDDRGLTRRWKRQPACDHGETAR